MKHCLIVDDSNAIRTVARRILKRLDFEVTEAEIVEAGPGAYRKRTPDLVWLDLHIRDSAEFLAAMRPRLRRRVPKVIVCAIESDDPDIGEAMRTGADGFILKPFDREIVEARHNFAAV